MQSTFSGIEMGKRSLIAHTQGLSTIGHNLSNASVEGYSRQRIEMKAVDPLYRPGVGRAETPGQIGQGVDVSSIQRVRDGLLERRIVEQSNGLGYWETRDSYLLQLEQVYNEPTDLSVRNLMDRFWQSWQDLANNPMEGATRQQIVERGQSLVDGIHNRYSEFKGIRDMVETDVEVTVSQVNTLLNKTADLSKEILRARAMGDHPNDLLDERDRLVKELSTIINITVDERDPDEFNIHTGGMHLLQGNVVTELEARPNTANEGYADVVWAGSGEKVQLKGGKLAALIELRDVDIREEIQKLDTMSINFADMVNDIHRDGYGTNGKTGLDFFVPRPFVNNVNGNYDSDGDGQFDSTYIFRMTGINSLEGKEQIGLEGTLRLAGPNGLVEVDYHPTDTVDDLVKRINTSGSEVLARLDRNGKLTLRGNTASNMENPDFVIRHVEDSGNFLTGYAGVLNESGEAGAYTWSQADATLALRGGELDFSVAPMRHPAGWLSINSVVADDPSSVAAGFGINGRRANMGDGSAATAIASLRNTDIMVGGSPSFDEYFSDSVASIGLKGQTAKIALETEQKTMQELEHTRESISGVNIDEELAQMIKFQHGYSAASRFITEFTKMIDTIINRMGV